MGGICSPSYAVSRQSLEAALTGWSYTNILLPRTSYPNTYSRDFPAACGDLSTVPRLCVSTKSHREDSLSLVGHLPMSCDLTFQPACLFFLSWNQIIFLSSNCNYIPDSKHHGAITRMILSFFCIGIERRCDWTEKQHHWEDKRKTL